MTREAQKLIFADGEIPTGANYSSLIDQIPLIVSLLTDLPTAAVGNLGQVYCVSGINYCCEETSTGVYGWVNKNAAAAANNYANASNKPLINSVVLSGDKDGDALKLLSNFSVLATGADPLALTSRLATDDGGDTAVSVQRTVQDLYDLFDIGNLPKYEKQNNPLLTSDGTYIKWIITHTCKTSEPLVQMFTKEGDLINYSTIALNNLTIRHLSSNEVEVEWNSAIDIAANEYYVVLIG